MNGVPKYLLTGAMIIAGALVFYATAVTQTEQPKTEQTKKEKPAEPWLAPDTVKEWSNPMAGNAEATTQGRKTYNQLCFVCHGKSGKGDGVGAAALDPKPVDFSSKAVQDQAAGEIFWKLSEGRGVMVAYKKTLSDEQRWQLVSYIRELGKVEDKESGGKDKPEKKIKQP